MRTLLFLSLVLTLVGHAFAQDQLAFRLNEKGLLKVLEMAVKYNTGANQRSIVIPKDIYKFTIPREQLHSNPIIPTLNEVSDLNLNSDLDFYLQTSDIQVLGSVDPKSLKTTISNSNSAGFDVRISLNLPQVSLKASSLRLCETRQGKAKKCGEGLQASISNLKVTTKTRPATLVASLRFTMKNGKIKVRALSANSNLESEKAPVLDINLEDSSIVIPPIVISVNGQEASVDTSKLKDQIIKRKPFLAKKLLAFAADFITSDLADMLNVYFAGTELNTTLRLYRRDQPEETHELGYPGESVEHAEYVRASLDLDRQQDTMKIIMAQVAEIIRHAQVDLKLNNVKTIANKDIQLGAALDLILNHTRYNVRNQLGNSHRVLPPLSLNPQHGSDLSLAISEPVVNGALELVNSTGLFQEILESTSDIPGFSIESVNIHFTNRNSLMLVGNTALDLKKLKANIWRNPRKWFKNKISSWLERNNNDGVIFFPIEMEISTKVAHLNTGGVSLKVQVKSPFSGLNLINTYKYPTNVDKMNSMVREGVMEELKVSLDPITGKDYTVDLSKFLNQSGVQFMPKDISFDQAAYMLIHLDIVDINFDSMKKTKK